MNDMDEVTGELVYFAAVIAIGKERTIRRRAQSMIAKGVPALWMDELLLQSILMVGWPRTLMAAGILRGEMAMPAAESEHDIDYAGSDAWRRRGEATCRIVYGDHYEKLLGNVHRLHPALDAWMLTEGYGRTLSRPGLDLKRREFCVIAQTAALDAPHQLHSHLHGALNAGATVREINRVLDILENYLPKHEFSSLKALWRVIRKGSTGES